MHLVSSLIHTDRQIATAIHDVLMQAYRVEADLLGLQDFVPLKRTVDRIQAASSTFLGILQQGILVAVAEVELEEGRLNISSLVVLPQHFRKGLATALLRHIVEGLGHQDISVSTAAQNRPALNLYASFDFHEPRSWTTFDGIPMVTLLRRATAPARTIRSG